MIDPVPAVTTGPLVNFGAQARVEVPASRTSDSYTLLNAGQAVGQAQDGSGATLVFLSDALRQDTVLEISAVSKATLPVDRRVRLPIAVRPNPRLSVRAQDATVTAGSATVILVDASQPGVSYQLRAGTATLGTAANGTGGTVSLPTGPIAAATTFAVAAARIDNAGANVTLTQTAAVAIKTG